MFGARGFRRVTQKLNVQSSIGNERKPECRINESPKRVKDTEICYTVYKTFCNDN